METHPDHYRVGESAGEELYQGVLLGFVEESR